MRRSDFLVTAGTAAGATMIPRRSSAAPVVKIGVLDSYTGALSPIATRHRAGAQFAIDKANGRWSVRHELVVADDANHFAVGLSEAKRLIAQEKIDVLTLGASSSVTLAVGATAQENNIFAVSMGSSAASVTGIKAKRVMFRLPPNTTMANDALLQRMLAYGKSWYFLVVDSAFGQENHTKLVARLKSGGGVEVGSDLVRQGTDDYSSALGKVRDSSADGLVLCQSSSDAAKAMRQFCAMGLNRTFRLVGVHLEDFEWQTLPCDQLAGALFPVAWSPAVSDSASKLAREMQPKLREPISFRHYFGYQCMSQIIDRIHAVGSTDAFALVNAFKEHQFDAAKTNPAIWRGCDHQCAQDEYVGALVSNANRNKTGMMFEIRGHVAPASGPECSDPDSAAAVKTMLLQKIGPREGYTPLKL